MSVILECKGLVKKYGSFFALSDLNLSIERGRIVGLLGPNGSGKTTLIKTINGLLVPDGGELTIDGKKPGVETKSMISYLPERTYLSNYMKVIDLIDFFADFYSDFDKAKAFEMLQRLSIDPKMKIKAMSKGTREKVQLILVMSRKSDLYCLDEPIGGVDPASRDYILNTILTNYSENATVLISTHLISDVEKILDDIIFLQNGHVALSSSVEEIRMNQGKSIDGLFREVFRC